MADRIFSDNDLAALYNAMVPRRVRSDFDFYLPLVMQAAAVLDVGCGTGAMLHEARDAGHRGRLCGLDPAAGMMAEARKRTDVEWFEGDLTSAAFENAFGLVVMTGHAFQVLVEDEDIRAALVAIRRALTEGGRLAFETRNPTAKAWEEWRPDKEFKFTGPDGARVRIRREVVSPFDGRSVTFTHTFTGANWTEPKVSQSTLRFLDAPSLDRLLCEAGLGVVQQYGDWDRTPLSDASPEIITIAAAR